VLASPGSTTKDISVEEKVMISLKTLASGSFQSSVKDLFAVTQPTVCRCLNGFVEALTYKAFHFIHMPRNQEECNEIKNGFFQIAGFPGVLGCVDRNHIPIVAPTVDEPANVNRKNFHSINVQAVCDSNLTFLDVVAQWPGSHRDSFIMNMPSICRQFENGEYGDGWLLGDNGNGLKRWLITPINNPVTTQVRRFNKAHRKIRSLIERSFGTVF